MPSKFVGGQRANVTVSQKWQSGLSMLVRVQAEAFTLKVPVGVGYSTVDKIKIESKL
jgi:hypothetical protein